MSIDWAVVTEDPPPRDMADRVCRLEDKAAMNEAINRWMPLIDHRRWSDLPACFDARVHVDYTALRPQPPAGWFEADKMIAGWKERYDGVVAYQHHIGNFLSAIDHDIARCSGSNVTTHERPSADGAGAELWHVGVYHRWQLARIEGRWLITHIAASRVWDRIDRIRT